MTPNRGLQTVERRALALILVIYALIASLYAVYTPAWQAPDEPAHYNYIRYLVETHHLPVLQTGDYPAAYLEEIKARRFPPEMSIDGIRYESHQPPLYYLLAVPAFVIGRALPIATPLLAVRLFSVTLGAIFIALSYHTARLALPEYPHAGWGTAAFIATLPMFAAISGAANNDVLAALVVTLVAHQLLVTEQHGWTTRRALGLGLAVGACLLTKLQAYIAVGLVAVAWLSTVHRLRTAKQAVRPMITYALIISGVAISMALPWFIRNMVIYGAYDPLGMVRHDEVVIGQLTTAELVSAIGPIPLLKRLCQTTFQSFWGQFGWMGVLLPIQVYQALAVLAGLAFLGVIDACLTLRRHGVEPSKRLRYILLGTWIILTVAGFLWYNLHYVQHQGRYLFPALVPLGLLFSMGLQRLFKQRPWWVLGALAGAGIFLIIWGAATQDIKGFALALVIGSLGGLTLGHEIERRIPGLPLALFYTGMAAFSLWCLWYSRPLLIP